MTCGALIPGATITLHTPSGSPSYQGLEVKTGMMLLTYTYWYYADFFKGGSCRDVPVTDT